MEEALIARLLGSTAVAPVAVDRITPGRRDQGAGLPALVVHKIDAPRDYHLSGDSGLVAARMQLDCWGETYRDAKRLARAVIADLSAARWVSGSVQIQGILIEDEADDTFDEGPETLFRTRLDVIVHHAIA